MSVLSEQYALIPRNRGIGKWIQFGIKSMAGCSAKCTTLAQLPGVAIGAARICPRKDAWQKGKKAFAKVKGKDQ